MRHHHTLRPNNTTDKTTVLYIVILTSSGRSLENKNLWSKWQEPPNFLVKEILFLIVDPRYLNFDIFSKESAAIWILANLHYFNL
jgi:hypothetical protein